jgi:hypothetical protein
LGQALEVEDLPFQDAPDITPAEAVVPLGFETLLDVFHRIVDDVLERLVARASSRFLPDHQGQDDQKHPNEERDQGEDRRAHPEKVPA